MIRAHYRAPDHRITATLLADAAGYASYSPANLHYGTIGRLLYEELPMELPVRKDGSLIYTYMLAVAGDKSGPEEHWVWQMRPEVAAAVEVLGLNK